MRLLGIPSPAFRMIFARTRTRAGISSELEMAFRMACSEDDRVKPEAGDHTDNSIVIHGDVSAGVAALFILQLSARRRAPISILRTWVIWGRIGGRKPLLSKTGSCSLK